MVIKGAVGVLLLVDAVVLAHGSFALRVQAGVGHPLFLIEWVLAGCLDMLCLFVRQIDRLDMWPIRGEETNELELDQANEEGVDAASAGTGHCEFPRGRAGVSRGLGWSGDLAPVHCSNVQRA